MFVADINPVNMVIVEIPYLGDINACAIKVMEV